MTDIQPSISEKLAKLLISSGREFEDASDYIWKSLRLVEHERTLEQAKLEDYFPDDPKLREFRWKRESHKLKHTFPYLITIGNLFSVLSLFETYLLLLVGDLETHTRNSLRSAKGQGISKLLNYIKTAGISYEEIPLYEQIQAAIRIRNCYAHASGMLSKSRDGRELRRLHASGAYLSKEHQKMRIEQGREFDEIQINETSLGDRLIVTNEYCHVLCSYLRSYFKALCTAADTKPI